jgi:hypothetical protein
MASGSDGFVDVYYINELSKVDKRGEMIKSAISPILSSKYSQSVFTRRLSCSGIVTNFINDMFRKSSHNITHLVFLF